MSDTETYEPVEALDEPAPAAGSLAFRMAHRADELERQRTETFEVPGWEDILAVELRLMGWQALRKIGRRHERLRDESLQELYVAADQILSATVGFYEVHDEDRTPIQEDWISLARRGVPASQLTDDLTPRQALIALVGDTRIMYLFADWQGWMKGERREVDEDVVRDFETTGSRSSPTMR